MSKMKTSKIQEINTSILSEQGYSEKEISTAFSWMAEKLETKKASKISQLQMFKNTSFRQLNDFEKNFFTKDALGNIIQLQAIGLLSNEHVDLMIERALMLGYKQINSNMVKQYIAAFMFDVAPPDHVGSRLSLNSYDKIN